MSKTSATNQIAHNDVDTAHAIPHRKFVQLVRARLDAEGHGDIPVSRQWIDVDTPGYQFLLNVPVGAEFVVPLKPLDNFAGIADPLVVERHVKHFAMALVNLRRAERTLIKYAGDMRRAAVKVIADARAEGLDVQLEGVNFKPTYAFHLSSKSWKEASYHVLANVKVRNTSFYLQPEVSEVYVEETEHLLDELADIFHEQRERQVRLAELDAAGADLIVDGITLDLLRTHAVDAAQALREAWKKQHFDVLVEFDGREARLSLITSDGKVESHIEVDGAYWNGEHVWLLREKIEDGLDLVGKTLAGKVSHPAIANRTVVHIDRSPSGDRQDLYHFDMSPTFLFDADTGRIWQQEVRLAA